MVKFISYDGKYPNLCRGTLMVEIDGEQIRFGYGDDCDYDPFWFSTGSCGFTGDWDSYVTGGEWECDGDLPEKFKQYQDELIELMNTNVELGCCGGCL